MENEDNFSRSRWREIPVSDGGLCDECKVDVVIELHSVRSIIRCHTLADCVENGKNYGSYQIDSDAESNQLERGRLNEKADKAESGRFSSLCSGHVFSSSSRRTIIRLIRIRCGTSISFCIRSSRCFFNIYPPMADSSNLFY